MRARNRITLIFIILVQVAMAQSNRYFTDLLGVPAFHQLNPDHTRTFYETSTSFEDLNQDSWFNFRSGMMAEDNGTPLFFDLGYAVYDGKTGKFIPGTDGIAITSRSKDNINRGKVSEFYNNSVVLQVDDSSYHMIYTMDCHATGLFEEAEFNLKRQNLEYEFLADLADGCYVHELVVGAQGMYMPHKNQKIAEEDYFEHIYDVKLLSDYTYLLLTQPYINGWSSSPKIANDSIVVMYLSTYSKKEGLIKRDSLMMPKNVFGDLLPIPLKQVKSIELNRFYTGTLSRSGDVMFLRAGSVYKVADFGNLPYNIDKHWMVDIDTTNFRFKIPKGVDTVLQLELNSNSNNASDVWYKDINNQYSNAVFSPNDSVLYFVEDYRDYNSDSWHGWDRIVYCLVKAWHFRTEDKRDAIVVDSVWSLNPKIDEIISPNLSLTPYGGIGMARHSIWEENRKYRYSSYDILEDANHPNKMGKNTIHKNRWSTFPPIHSANISIYQYIRLEDTTNYDCEARVQLQNQSDLSGGMEDFEWYFTKEDGSIDTVSGFEPEVVYTRSGDYPFKCHGYSPRGKGYGEYYLDTLHVRIPEKPVPDFEVSETVVCAHVPLSFVNNSSTQQQHPTRAQQWVWTFGDGQTYTTDTAEMVTHAYAQAGVYSVSLHYYNGYCDSTLVKNQYIRVVEAPAPGFAIDNNRGCSPFGLLVTDTITQFVRKKEYNYYDGTGWHEVPKDQPEISVNYPNAGNYWVVQRLYGYTGCITQQDSVRVYVTPGITQSDTVHTQKGSYLNHASAVGALKINYRGEEYWHGTPEQIEIEWTSQAAAVSYHIYRDGLKLATVDSPDLVYYDEIGMPREVEYRVTGEDSCGHETSWGRYARPIYLHGEHLDNEIAVIRFTPYGETIQEMEYQVYVEEMGEWEMLSEVGEQEEYKDRGYAQRTSERMIEKCYVVSDVAGEIWSNVMCLAYQPTVFAPTAFTPNGDGINDVYHIQTYGIVNYEAEVYNRYGQKITSFTDQDIGWSGEDAPMGAYLLHLQARDINGNRYNTKQTISVVR